MKNLRILLLIVSLTSRVGKGNICGEWGTGDAIKGNSDYDVFGSAVATSSDGKVFAVGAPRGLSSRNSYVKVYQYNSSTNETERLGTNYKIVPRKGENVPVQRAGSSISLSADGRTIAIGDIENENPSEHDSDVFVMSGGVSVFVLKTLSDGSKEWRQLGKRVTLYGGFLQTTTSVQLSSNGYTFIIASSGSGVGVYGKTKVFKYNVIIDDWEQQGNTIAEKSSNTFLSDEVSVSLSGSGNVIAVGSSKNSDAGKFRGRVRVFEFLNGSWSLRSHILSGSVDHEQFGSSVELSEDGYTLAVGSAGSDDNRGKVEVFKYDADGPVKWTKIGDEIIGPEKNSYFGTAVSITSVDQIPTLAIGAYADNESRGSVRIYRFGQDGRWVQVGENIFGSGDDYLFGASVALSANGKRLIVGSPLSNRLGAYSGIASVFNLNQESCVPTQAPSIQPTITFSPSMSQHPSMKPTFSSIPSQSPSFLPSSLPSIDPSNSQEPSSFPQSLPSLRPSILPSIEPSKTSTAKPSRSPTLLPTFVPTTFPSRTPSSVPSEIPTILPSYLPTSPPSQKLSILPTILPSYIALKNLTGSPKGAPSITQNPSKAPTYISTDIPSILPSPSRSPTIMELDEIPKVLKPERLDVSIASKAKVSESLFQIPLIAIATVLIVC